MSSHPAQLCLCAVSTLVLAGLQAACSSPPTVSPQPPRHAPVAEEVRTWTPPDRAREIAADDKRLRDEQPAIEQRAARIQAELHALPDRKDLPESHWAREWAGNYYVGDGLGMNVAIGIAPDSGITYMWHGCLGLYDGDHGAVSGVFDDDGDGRVDGVNVDWTLRSKSGYGYTSGKLYFVRWEGPPGEPGRRYLVPEAQMLEVVNDFNAGSYARRSQYSAPLKSEPGNEGGSSMFGGGAPVCGCPQLPARWASLLVHQRLTAIVTAATPRMTGDVTNSVDFTSSRVTLDKGHADGVYPGMHVSFEQGFITMDRVGAHWAEGAFVSFTGENEPATIPAVGQELLLAAGDSDRDPMEALMDRAEAENEAEEQAP